MTACIVALDIETTGLLHNYHRVLEIASSIVLPGGEPLPDGRFHGVISCTPETILTISPVVAKMHADSGLWDAIMAPESTDGPYRGAEDAVLEAWLRWVCNRTRDFDRVYMLGSNVLAFDMPFLITRLLMNRETSKNVEYVRDKLTRRAIEVGSLYMGETGAPLPLGLWDAAWALGIETSDLLTHRAPDDVELSLRIYRLLATEPAS